MIIKAKIIVSWDFCKEAKCTKTIPQNRGNENILILSWTVHYYLMLNCGKLKTHTIKCVTTNKITQQRVISAKQKKWNYKK